MTSVLKYSLTAMSIRNANIGPLMGLNIEV
jgi:hypothetical protein